MDPVLQDPLEASDSASTPDQAIPDQLPLEQPPTSAAPAPAATPQAPGPGWVPSHRLRETREAAIRESQAQWEARQAQIEASYQAQLEQMRRQLHALAGVTPPENPEIAAVRSQFEQLYPGLAQLERRAQDIVKFTEQWGERSQDLDSHIQRTWRDYGRSAMDRLYSLAEKSYGAPLSDDGKRALHAAFLGHVSSDPNVTVRYAEDPAIVEEFWKSFSGALIDPVRRAQAAAVQQQATRQATLPKDTPSGAPQTTPPPKQSADPSERMRDAWASYQAHTAGKKL